MLIKKLSCFYYPTTVVIVDDNISFLESLPDNLSNSVNYKFFSSPQEAIDFLKNNQESQPSPYSFLETTDSFCMEKSLNANIPKIQSLLHNTKRHETPCVIVTDQDMPGISGQQLCETLSTLPVKKIMLTGAGDSELAIDAFNSNLIDKFIKKNDAHVFQKINQAISELQQEWFLDITSPLMNTISASRPTLLNQTPFQDFFAQLLKENNIREFYLIDSLGSFLLIDKNHKLTWFVVQSENDIDNYLSIAKDSDVPEEITNLLSRREKLVCLLTDEDLNQPVDHWPQYLHNANELQGIPGHYYAWID